MAETVNEPLVFEESDFADDQTTDTSSPAVEETTEQPTSENKATDSTDDSTNANESKTGDEIEEFLAKKGVKLDDPEALRKVAEMYRNVEKDYGKKSQEKAQLERQLEQLNAQQVPTTPSMDPMERVQALERQLAADRQLAAVKDWKAAKNLSPEVEAKMVEFLSQPLEANGVKQTDNLGNPLTKMFLVQAGALSYDDVFRAVGGDSFKADAVKQELKAAVANEIAAKQNAKSPTSLATDSTQFAQPKTADDEFVDGLFDN
ncbi:hypothetical protein IKF88_00590 [Candidatus Saccharibacteria bacterium]|nr:hypothetical protein [Candidatus Saccharibacteria bacterium]